MEGLRIIKAVRYDKDGGNFVTWLTKNVPEASDELKDLISLMHDGTIQLGKTGDIDKLFDSMNIKDYRKEFKAFVADNTYAEKSLSNFQTYLKNSSAGMTTFARVTKTASTVAKSFAASLGSMAVMWAIGEAIGFVVQQVDNYIHRVDIAKESIEEISSTINGIRDDFQSTQKTVSDTGERFAELAQGVDSLTGKNLSLNTEDYEEFLQLSNQLAELFPSLPRIYDSNGNAIVQLSGNVDTIVGSLNNLVEVQQRIANQQIADALPELYSNAKTVSDDYVEQTERIEASIDTLSQGLDNFTTDSFVKELEAGIQTGRLEVATKDIEAYSRVVDDYTKILNDAGIDYTLATDISSPDLNGEQLGQAYFNINTESLTSDAKANIEKAAQELAEQYGTSIADLNTEIQAITEKNASNWSGLSSSIAAWLNTDDTYRVMSDTMQATIQKAINNLDFTSLTVDYGTWAELESYLQENLLGLYDTASGKQTLADLEVALGVQTQFNNGEVSVGEYQAKLQELLSAIEGLDDETRKAIMMIFGIEMDDDGNTSFDTDPIITNVQNKLQDSFDGKVLELDATDLEIASNLEIPESTLLSWDELKEKIEEVKLAESELEDVNVSLSTTDAIESLANLESEMSNLDEAMAELTDLEDGQIDISTLNDLRESLMAFENVDADLVSQSLEQLADTSSVEEAQSAIDALANEYLRCSGILDGLTESNSALIEKQLEAIGITNAHQVVTQQLMLAKMKEKIETEGLTNATIDEINKLMEEQGYTDAAQQSMYRLYLTKLDINANTIQTADDIANIIALANAAGASYAQLMALQQLLALMGDGSAYASSYNDADAQRAEQRATSGYKNSSASSVQEYVAEQAKKITSEMANAWTDLDPADYGGSSATQSARDSNAGSGGGGGGGSTAEEAAEETQNAFYSVYDWMERRINYLQDIASKAIDKIKDSLAYASDEDFVSKALKDINTQMKQNAHMASRYQQSANDTGLSQEWRDLIESGGNIDYSEITDEALSNQISAYEEWYKKSQEASEANEELKDTVKDLAETIAQAPIDKAAEKIEKYATAIDLIDSKIDNATSADEANSLINRRIRQVDNTLNANFNAYVTASGNTDTYSDNITSQGVSKKATDKQKKQFNNLMSKVKSATSSGKVIGDKVMDSIYAYCNSIGSFAWYINCQAYNAAVNAEQAARDTYEAYVEEAKTERANAALEKFENTQTEYDNQRARNGQRRTSIENEIALAEAQGGTATVAGYNRLISNEQADVNKLISERADLQDRLNKAVKSGNVEQGSSQWYEMIKGINDVTNAIAEGTIAIEEYENALRQLRWDTFDRSMDTLSQLTDEANFYLDLISDRDMVDDSGNFTEYGIASATLRNENLEQYIAQAEEYQDENDRLLAKINSGEESASDQVVIDRLRELEDARQDSILAANAERQAIADLVSEAYEQQIDALDDMITKYMELKDAEKDAYDYQKDIADRMKNIASLQKQLMAYGNNDSEESRAQIQRIKLELEEAQSDLEDAQYDKYISDTNDMLDDLMESYQEFIDNKLSDTDSLIQEVQAQIATSGSATIETLNEVKNGFSTSIDGLSTNLANHLNGVISAIENANNTVASDQSNITDTTSNTTTGTTSDTYDAEAIANQVAVEAQRKSLKAQISMSKEAIKQLEKQMNALAKEYSKNQNLIIQTKGDKKQVLKDTNNSLDKQMEALEQGLRAQIEAMESAQQQLAALPSYATGTKKVPYDQLAITHPGELISDGGTLTQLSAGDKVFTEDMTNTLWELAKGNLPTPNLNLSTPDLSNLAGGEVTQNQTVSIDMGGIVLEGVQDPEEFARQMRVLLATDKRTQKVIKSVTNDVSMGKSIANATKYI